MYMAHEMSPLVMRTNTDTDGSLMNYKHRMPSLHLSYFGPDLWGHGRYINDACSAPLGGSNNHILQSSSQC